MDRSRQLGHKSGSKPGTKTKELLGFEPSSLGHSYPQQYPYPEGPQFGKPQDLLAAPLSIRGVASLIGGSPWTIRQGYIPAGLPHHRLAPNGKLIFYKNQIIRWLLARQQKGGN